MKNIKYYIFTTISILISTLYSYANIDSISFETQRNIVNTLLDERVKKFEEYDISLDQKTGFFGLMKSKNDMQKSINILQEIVKFDNRIFIETRELLKIKDNQADKYQELATQYDNQVTAYMRTISKLQATTEKLNQEIESFKKEDHNDNKLIFVFCIIVIALSIIIFKQYKLLKSKKLTKL